MISSQHLINDNLIQNRTFQLMNKGKSVAEKRTQSLDYMIGASIIFFMRSQECHHSSKQNSDCAFCNCISAIIVLICALPAFFEFSFACISYFIKLYLM